MKKISPLSIFALLVIAVGVGLIVVPMISNKESGCGLIEKYLTKPDRCKAQADPDNPGDVSYCPDTKMFQTKVVVTSEKIDSGFLDVRAKIIGINTYGTTYASDKTSVPHLAAFWIPEGELVLEARSGLYYEKQNKYDFMKDTFTLTEFTLYIPLTDTDCDGTYTGDYGYKAKLNPANFDCQPSEYCSYEIIKSYTGRLN